MTQSASVSVRKATHYDIEQVKILADANRDALGFILRATLLEGIMKGWIFVAEDENLEMIGFVHYRHRKDSQTTLYDLCVKGMWRRKGVGRLLVQSLALESKKVGKKTIRLKSPSGLDANSFYQSCGFLLVDVEKGKKRSLNIWELPIQY